MLAVRELIASGKCYSVPVAFLDHLAHEADRALAQSGATYHLEANLISGDLAKLPDIAGWLATVGDEVHAPARTRQRDVEKAPLLSIGEGFRPGNDQAEPFIVLDAARYAMIAFTHIEQNRVVRLKPFSPVKGQARNLDIGEER